MFYRSHLTSAVMTASQWSRVGTIAVLLPLLLVGIEGRSIAAGKGEPISARHLSLKQQISVQLLAATPEQIQHKMALVIGNSNYGSTDNLKNPVNDAEDMEKVLKLLGFEVTLLKDLEQQSMEQAIEDFNKRLQQKNGVGLFYYAGHGVQVGGENYLIPVKAKINREQDVRFRAIPLSQVLGAMEDAQNPFNIVILDACRDNPIIRKFRSSKTRGLSAVMAPEGMIIAFATAPGNVSEDGEGRNSPYTASLLQHIQTPELPIQLIFEKVRESVRNKTGNRQSPRYESSIGGNFTFKPIKSDLSKLNLPSVTGKPAKIESELPVEAVQPLLTSGERKPIDLPNPRKTGGVVVIDPGHGGADTGTIGIGGIQESQVTLDISLQVAKFLRQKNIQVVMTRETDIYLDLQPRIDIANNWKGKDKVVAFVSIHGNAINMTRPDVNGLESYYHPNFGDALAKAIHSSILESGDIRDRGIRTAKFYVLRNSPSPSALIETGFLTGNEDASQLANPEFRSRRAKSIARGILRFLDSL